MAFLSREYRFVGLQNYARLFADPVFWQTVRNSFVFTFGSEAIRLLIGLPLAFALNRSFKGKRAVFCGGSRGIGRSIAMALAEGGAAVSICARGADGLAKTADELGRFSEEFRVFKRCLQYKASWP